MRQKAGLKNKKPMWKNLHPDPYREKEELKNSFKKQVLELQVELNGKNSVEYKRQKQLFIRYNYGFTELINMIVNLKKSLGYMVSPLSNIQSYEKWHDKYFSKARQ